jgi:hypothetical protein
MKMAIPSSMTRTVAILDVTGNLQGALTNLADTAGLVIRSYATPEKIASALNDRTLSPDDMALLLACIGRCSPDDTLRLLKQLHGHSRLSAVPVLVLGGDDAGLRRSCEGLCPVRGWNSPAPTSRWGNDASLK